MRDKLMGVIIASFLSSKDKNELIEYVEMIIEKASMYDDLCD